MTGEPRIAARNALADLGAEVGGEQARAGTSREAPDERDRQRFEQAMSSPPQAPVAQSDHAPPSVLLFAPLGRSAPVVSEVPPPSIENELLEALASLRVGDSAGRKQVRMALGADLLPGVNIVLQETEGRLQVDFICSDEDSRLLLNRALPTQSTLLARRLRRAVLIRTQTDDEEDPHLFEFLASP